MLVTSKLSCTLSVLYANFTHLSVHVCVLKREGGRKGERYIDQ